MFISADGKFAALFDLLGWAPAFGRGPGVNAMLAKEVEEQLTLGRKVQDELNKAARWGGQEFNLKIEDDAWVLTVFSCFGSHSGGDRDLLRVIIPKDTAKPVRVETFEAPVETVVPERRTVVTP